MLLSQTKLKVVRVPVSFTREILFLKLQNNEHQLRFCLINGNNS